MENNKFKNPNNSTEVERTMARSKIGPVKIIAPPCGSVADFLRCRVTEMCVSFHEK